MALCSGRKRLCQVFCITYTLTCACITLPFLPVLFVGRLLGGVSTSILYSAFESWVVSSSNNLALPQADLSGILGRATLLNGFVAAGAGVFSNWLVGSTNSFASPFIASGALLVLGFFVIGGLWTENYGGADVSTTADGSGIFQLKRLGKAMQIVRNGKRLVCCLYLRSASTLSQIRNYWSSGSPRPVSRALCTSSSSYGYHLCKKLLDPRTHYLLDTSFHASWCP